MEIPSQGYSQAGCRESSAMLAFVEWSQVAAEQAAHLHLIRVLFLDLSVPVV